MHTSKKYQKVSAIIAAYNEQNTISNVIKRLKDSSLVDEVIVVSDGSTDMTAQIARRAKAIVVELQTNVGKGNAMAIGVEHAKHDVLLFADADLIGFNDSMVNTLVEKACIEHYDMFTLIRDRGVELYQQYFYPEYNIGGERVITRELWNSVPAKDRRGFGVELALNYYAVGQGCRIGQELAPGLRQVIKEKKRGLIWGFIARVDMFFQCLWTYVRLFVFHRLHLTS